MQQERYRPQESQKKELIGQFQLQICPNCGEPVFPGASHKCGELGKFLSENNISSGELRKIYDEAQGIFSSGVLNMQVDKSSYDRLKGFSAPEKEERDPEDTVIIEP